MASKLDPAQIAKAVYDAVNESLKVSIVNALALEMELSANDGDSVRAYTALEPVGYNYVSFALSAANTVVTETYRSGGSGGTIVGTITKVYTDNTRTVLVSIERT